MIWLKRLLLVVLVVIGLLALFIYLVFFHKTSHRIVGQYVDYDCQPVANADFQFRANMSSGVPYGGGAQRRHDGQTDAQGYFRIEFDTNWRLDNFILALSREGDDHQGRRRFNNWSEVQQALESDEQTPVYIYRQSPHDFNHRFNGRQGYKLNLRAGGGLERNRVSVSTLYHPLSTRTIQRQVVGDFYFRWQPDSEGWSLTLVASKSGGFIEYPVQRMPFDANIPQQGYRKSVSLRLPSKANPEVRRAYYYRHNAGEAYGMLFLNAGFENHGYGGSVLLNLVQDLRANEPGSTEAPVLPQLTCGGKAPKGMAESYIALSEAYGYRGTSAGYLESPSSQSAADPDTPLEWFHLHLDDPVVLNNALASYGDVSERYPVIYPASRDWLRLHLEDPEKRRLRPWRDNPVLRIARDERTPPEILERILIDFPTIPAAVALSENPALPENTVDRIANGLLNNQYESIDDPHETQTITRTLAGNPRLGADSYLVLTERLLDKVESVGKNQLNHEIATFLQNPGVPAKVLATWTDRALKADMSAIGGHLLRHPNTSPADLRRLGEHFFRAEYRTAFSRYGQFLVNNKFLDNENIPHDLLYRYVTVMTDLSDRMAYQALLHPKFDRDVLSRMLTIENIALAEGLLEYRQKQNPSGYGPVTWRYNLPGDVIAEIHELSNDWRLQSAIARNPNTPPTILDAMMDRAEQRLDWQLIQNTALSTEHLRSLRERLTPAHADGSLAANPATPEDIQISIADSGDWTRKLLENPGTSGPALDKLFSDKFDFPDPYRYRQRLEQLLWHPNITPALMDRILKEQEDEALLQLALRIPSTDAMVLEKIWLGEYLEFLGSNPGASSKAVNDGLAGHPNTPWHIKRKLQRY